MSAMTVTVKAGVLSITVNLAQAEKEAYTSPSGKSLVLASTHGNTALEGGLMLGVNLFKRKAQ